MHPGAETGLRIEPGMSPTGAYQMMMLGVAIREAEEKIVIDVHHFLGHHDHNI
jgi:hypothetical protein